MVHRLRSVSLILALGLLLGAPAVRAEDRSSDPPVIAAAADLRFALDEIAKRFHDDSGKDVSLSFGSSGEFTRQIEQGAPFQMFLSADEGFVFRLADAGRTVDRGTLYAIGRIVLFAATGSPLKVDSELADLRAALADGRIRKFAIANPEHAPYGRAAEQALRSQQLWEPLVPLLVLGENAAQATQFASSGSAQGGILPYSLAIAPAVSALGTYALIPAGWHDPLRQRMVLLQGASDTTRAFYAYLQTPAAREIFRRFGFLLPEEAS